jgi:hypothetical protein
MTNYFVKKFPKDNEIIRQLNGTILPAGGPAFWLGREATGETGADVPIGTMLVFGLLAA